MWRNESKKSNKLKRMWGNLNQPALRVRVRQANTQKARVSPAKLREEKQKLSLNKDTNYSVPSVTLHLLHAATCVQLTAMISALEMVGAMLLMNREQVLWRGRGLGESSLGFFSSFLSSSASSFGFSSSPLDERAQRGGNNYELWILGTQTLHSLSKHEIRRYEFDPLPSPSSSSSSLSSTSSFFTGLSEQLEFESESESESLSEALPSSSLSPLRFLFLLGWWIKMRTMRAIWWISVSCKLII